MESLSDDSISLAPSSSDDSSSDAEMDIMPILGSPFDSVIPLKKMECPPMFIRLIANVYNYELKNDGSNEVLIDEKLVDESLPLCLGNSNVISKAYHLHFCQHSDREST